MRKTRSIPQQRIIEKMNDYMSRRDYAGAERHLLYWLAEAGDGGDRFGELFVRNELIGHYRKTGEKDNALESIREALRLLHLLDFENSISAGTTYVNAGTAYLAFDYKEEALDMFAKARTVYESSGHTGPQLLAGLYNNMALAYTAVGQFADADALYRRALSILDGIPDGGLEQAITLLNMADAVSAEKGSVAGEHTIFGLLDRALSLLDEAAGRTDGYYAFVCEKCAPVFSHYGYFAAANTLTSRAGKIYGRDL